MVPQMVDCRSLIEFCRAFQKRCHMDRSSQSRRRTESLNPLCHPFCENSPVASVDVVMLLLVLVAFGVLTVPWFKFVFNEAYEHLPAAMDVVGDALYHAPVAYAAGFVLMLATAVASWEFLSCQARKCGSPHCKGLRRAEEFDIQLESEECIRHLPPLPMDAIAARPLELGQDRKELAAELKKMAPPNGRTVLIFRAPCGCPAGRMEVWGPKKVRRIKK